MGGGGGGYDRQRWGCDRPGDSKHGWTTARHVRVWGLRRSDQWAAWRGGRLSICSMQPGGAEAAGRGGGHTAKVVDRFSEAIHAVGKGGWICDRSKRLGVPPEHPAFIYVDVLPALYAHREGGGGMVGREKAMTVGAIARRGCVVCPTIPRFSCTAPQP